MQHPNNHENTDVNRKHSIEKYPYNVDIIRPLQKSNFKFVKNPLIIKKREYIPKPPHGHPNIRVIDQYETPQKYSESKYLYKKISKIL